MDEEEKEEEESYLPVTAALSKIDAGVALLVRGVCLALLCFYSGRRGMCICCVCFARAFTFFEVGRVPSRNNMRRVSIVTADSAVYIFC